MLFTFCTFVLQRHEKICNAFSVETLKWREDRVVSGVMCLCECTDVQSLKDRDESDFFCKSVPFDLEYIRKQAVIIETKMFS